MILELPESVVIGGKEYEINSDFRCIIGINLALADAELTNEGRIETALRLFYPDVMEIPEGCLEEAIQRMFWFIRGGDDSDPPGKRAKLMDWEQDMPYIISPVNRIIGHDIRGDRHFHWWSFMAAYMDIGECTFAQIVHVRSMKAEGKTLGKADAEWYKKNCQIVDLKVKYTERETDLLALWGGEISAET